VSALLVVIAMACLGAVVYLRRLGWE
jgi:hypothetical protein